MAVSEDWGAHLYHFWNNLDFPLSSNRIYNGASSNLTLQDFPSTGISSSPPEASELDIWVLLSTSCRTVCWHLSSPRSFRQQCAQHATCSRQTVAGCRAQLLRFVDIRRS